MIAIFESPYFNGTGEGIGGSNPSKRDKAIAIANNSAVMVSVRTA